MQNGLPDLESGLRQRPTPEQRLAELAVIAQHSQEFQAQTADSLARNDRRLNYLGIGGVILIALAGLSHFFNPTQDENLKNDSNLILVILGFSAIVTSIVTPRDPFGLQNFDRMGSTFYKQLLAEHTANIEREAAENPANSHTA